MEFLTIILYAVMMTQATQSDDVEKLLDNSLMMINNSQYEEALIYLDKILAIDENNLQALSNKGGVLIKLKKYDEAIKYFDKVLTIKSDSVEALNNKAIALYSIGDYEQASNVLLQAVDLDPNNQLTMKNMGSIIEKVPYIVENGYAKIEVSDKNGNLVAYTEAYKFLIKYPFGNSLLMHNSWEDVEVKGQKVQKLKNEWNFNLTKTGLYSRTDISSNREGAGFPVIEILHDGILVTDGDQVKVILELFRQQ